MKTKSKIMVLAPVCIFVALIVCFIIAGFLEFSTNRGLVYSILMIVAIVGTMISPILCSISAVMGMVFAIKARKSGENNIGWIMILGIFEIMVSVVVVFLVLYTIFVSGPSV